MSELTIDELRRLADLYDLEGYLFETVSARFAEAGTLAPYDFFAIVVWKSNRSKTRVKEGLRQARKTVERLMAEVARAPTPEARVQTLTAIGGIGLPIASAILAVCYPEEFTVLDTRAWNALVQASVDGLPGCWPRTAAHYVQYCRACRDFARAMGLSLRELDQALWAKDWEDDLLGLIGG